MRTNRVYACSVRWTGEITVPQTGWYVIIFDAAGGLGQTFVDGRTDVATSFRWGQWFLFANRAHSFMLTYLTGAGFMRPNLRLLGPNSFDVRAMPALVCRHSLRRTADQRARVAAAPLRRALSVPQRRCRSRVRSVWRLSEWHLCVQPTVPRHTVRPTSVPRVCGQ